LHLDGIIINSLKAKGITEIFLEQHFSILEIKEPILEDGIWIVKAVISAFGEHPRTVQIDAKSGKIISWDQ